MHLVNARLIGPKSSFKTQRKSLTLRRCKEVCFHSYAIDHKRLGIVEFTLFRC